MPGWRNEASKSFVGKVTAVCFTPVALWVVTSRQGGPKRIDAQQDTAGGATALSLTVGNHGSHSRSRLAGTTCADANGDVCCEAGTYACMNDADGIGYCCPGADYTVCGMAPDGSGVCSASLTSVLHSRDL